MKIVRLLIQDCLNEAKERAQTIINDLEAQSDLNESLKDIADAAENVRLGGLKILAGSSFRLTYQDNQINLQLPDISKIDDPAEADQKLKELLREIEISQQKLATYLTRCEIGTANRVSAAIDMSEFEAFAIDSDSINS